MRVTLLPLLLVASAAAIAVNCPDGWAETVTLTGTQTFSFPEYADSARCSMLVTAPAGQAVSVQFTAVSTESCCDRFVMYNGDSITDRRIISVGGSTVPAYTFVSAGNVATIYHFSDGSVTGSGANTFQLSAVPAAPAPFNAPVDLNAIPSQLFTIPGSSLPSATLYSTWIAATNFTAGITVDSFGLGTSDQLRIYSTDDVSGSASTTITSSTTIPTSRDTGSAAPALTLALAPSGTRAGTLSFRLRLLGCPEAWNDLTASADSTRISFTNADLANNIRCTMVVSAEPNSTVSIRFNSVALESGSDRISIYDGAMSSGRLLAVATGTTALSGVYYSATGTLTLYLTTDGSVLTTGTTSFNVTSVAPPAVARSIVLANNEERVLTIDTSGTMVPAAGAMLPIWIDSPLGSYVRINVTDIGLSSQDALIVRDTWTTTGSSATLTRSSTLPYTRSSPDTQMAFIVDLDGAATERNTSTVTLRAVSPTCPEQFTTGINASEFGTVVTIPSIDRYLDCATVINVPAGYVVGINFTSSALNSFQSISVYDGDRLTGRRIGMLAGSTVPVYTFVTSGTRMTLVLSTDSTTPAQRDTVFTVTALMPSVSLPFGQINIAAGQVYDLTIQPSHVIVPNMLAPFWINVPSGYSLRAVTIQFDSNTGAVLRTSYTQDLISYWSQVTSSSIIPDLSVTPTVNSGMYFAVPTGAVALATPVRVRLSAVPNGGSNNCPAQLATSISLMSGQNRTITFQAEDLFTSCYVTINTVLGETVDVRNMMLSNLAATDRVIFSDSVNGRNMLDMNVATFAQVPAVRAPAGSITLYFAIAPGSSGPVSFWVMSTPIFLPPPFDRPERGIPIATQQQFYVSSAVAVAPYFAFARFDTPAGQLATIDVEDYWFNSTEAPAGALPDGLYILDGPFQALTASGSTNVLFNASGMGMRASYNTTRSSFYVALVLRNPMVGEGFRVKVNSTGTPRGCPMPFAGASITATTTAQTFVVSSSDLDNGLDCTASFMAATGSAVRVTVTQVNLESNYDFIYVLDGPTATDLPLATLNGQSSTTFSATSRGNSVTMRLVTDGSVIVSGFTSFTIAAVPPTTGLGFFDTKITALTQTSTDFTLSNGQVPALGSVATAGFTVPNGRTVVVTLGAYNLGSAVLVIDDWVPGVTRRYLNTITGSGSSFTFTSTGSRVFISLASAGSTIASGFTVNIQQVGASAPTCSGIFTEASNLLPVSRADSFSSSSASLSCATTYVAPFGSSVALQVAGRTLPTGSRLEIFDGPSTSSLLIATYTTSTSTRDPILSVSTSTVTVRITTPSTGGSTRFSLAFGVVSLTHPETLRVFDSANGDSVTSDVTSQCAAYIEGCRKAAGCIIGFKPDITCVGSTRSCKCKPTPSVAKAIAGGIVALIVILSLVAVGSGIAWVVRKFCMSKPEAKHGGAEMRTTGGQSVHNPLATATPYPAQQYPQAPQFPTQGRV